jgi:hypothetical protein
MSMRQLGHTCRNCRVKRKNVIFPLHRQAGRPACGVPPCTRSRARRASAARIRVGTGRTPENALQRFPATGKNHAFCQLRDGGDTKSQPSQFKWGGRWDSNPRRPESQSGALPTELRPPSSYPNKPAFHPAFRDHLRGAPGRTRTCDPRLRRPMLYPAELRAHGLWAMPVPDLVPACLRLVGAEGFEPPTLCSQSRCATRLRHAPPDLRLMQRRQRTAGNSA